MTSSVLSDILSSETLTAGKFALLFGAAIALGLVIALVYSCCGDCTKHRNCTITPTIGSRW